MSKQAKIALVNSKLEDRQDMTVQEMKLYVQRLPQIISVKKALSLHTTIAECIKEVTYTEEFLDNLHVSIYKLVYFSVLKIIVLSLACGKETLI